MQNKKPYLLLAPSFILIILLFVGSLLNGLLESKSIKYYKEVLKFDEFWDSFVVTLRVSVVSTVLAVVIGMSIIFIIYLFQIDMDKKTSLLIQRLFQIPMIFPYIVSAYMMFLLFTQGGFFSRILFNTGLITEMTDFPVMVNDRWGIGIIVSYVWKTSPFVVLMVYPALTNIESGWIDVKQVFHASKWNFFKEIVFPMTKDTLVVTGYIIFCYTFLSFEIPYILGTTYPKTLSVYSYNIYSTGSLIDRPKAFVINILSVVFIFMIAVIYKSVIRIIVGRRTSKRDKSVREKTKYNSVDLVEGGNFSEENI